MVISKNHLKAILPRMRNKSQETLATYKVTAVAYSNNGNILGYASNNIRDDIVPHRRGAGAHAEWELIKRYGKNIKYIVISRFGDKGILRPIDPCPNCKKMADNLGIRIIKLMDYVQE